MDFLWYLLVGFIGFIFGGACGIRMSRRKKAGTLRLIKDECDDSYYLAADLDIHPADLIREKQVLFDIRDTRKPMDILEIRKDVK